MCIVIKPGTFVVGLICGFLVSFHKQQFESQLEVYVWTLWQTKFKKFSRFSCTCECGDNNYFDQIFVRFPVRKNLNYASQSCKCITDHFPKLMGLKEVLKS